MNKVKVTFPPRPKRVVEGVWNVADRTAKLHVYIPEDDEYACGGHFYEDGRVATTKDMTTHGYCSICAKYAGVKKSILRKADDMLFERRVAAIQGSKFMPQDAKDMQIKLLRATRKRMTS